jgi:tetratricopeptide (TPR) repeat protein/transglutaminase-like putative cysteine protease
MRSFAGTICLALVAACPVPYAASAAEPTASPATTAAKSQAASPAADPVRVKILTNEVKIEADGQYTVTTRMQAVALNDSAAKSIAQVAIPFRDSIDELEIVEAYTLKADGQKLKVAPTSIFLQMPTGAANVPMFNDNRQKVIVFPRVQGGDAISYTTRLRVKVPYFPGAYFMSAFYPKSVAYHDARYSITAPKSMELNVKAVGVTVAKSNDAANTTYSWKHVAPNAEANKRRTAIVRLDDIPQVLMSTFKNYDEVGRAYAQILQDKVQTTPKIRALADEITAGVSDRRQQAQKIYEWVSRNTRYVSVALGVGSIVPHTAETVLNNGYGDCKDHAVLFTALLNAKGIKSETVLINSGLSYELSPVPSFNELNHVITWIPELEMYTDTTSGLAPFGVLSFDLYGKPVIHATSDGRVRNTTPVLPPDIATFSTKTSVHIDTLGRAHGDTQVEAKGPYSIALRAIGASIESSDAQDLANYFEDVGDKGTGAFSVAPSAVLSPQYAMRGDFAYALEPKTFDGAETFYPSLGLRLTDTVGDALMGPAFDEDLPETEPTPCYSGTQTRELSLFPPPGHLIGKLPENTDVKDKHMHYQSEWKRAGRAVILRRTMTAKIDTALCSGEVRKSAARILAEIRKDYDKTLAFVTEPAITKDDYRKLDPAFVTEFDRAIAANPKNPAAYVNRGGVYSHMRQFKKAIDDYDKAIALNANYPSAYVQRAVALRMMKAPDKAMADVNKAIALDPDASEAYVERAILRTFGGGFKAAGPDIEKAKALDARGTYFNTLYTTYLVAEQRGNEALAEMDKLVARDPKNSEHLIQRSSINAMLGRGDAAAADADAAIALGDTSPRAKSARGKAMLMQRKYKEAIADLDQAISGETQEVSLYVTRGMAHHAIYQYERAIADYDKALALDPGNKEARAMKAEAQEEFKNKSQR